MSLQKEHKEIIIVQVLDQLHNYSVASHQLLQHKYFAEAIKRERYLILLAALEDVVLGIDEVKKKDLDHCRIWD